MTAYKQWMPDRAKTHLVQSAGLKRRVADECIDSIIKVATLMAGVFAAGKKVMLCGNGGSAADCQHIAAEFMSVLTQDFRRPGMRAISLTTDTSYLTAFANDFGYEGLFARQVETLGVEGDLLIGISTSGNSKNIIRAVEAAKTLKMLTVALTGENGRLATLADLAIAVPCSTTQYIQEMHITIGHILCDLVERSLFKGE